MAENLLTPEFRASFVHVFTPQKAMNAGKPDKFTLTMLFHLGADLSNMKKAATEAVQAEFGSRLTDNTPVNPKLPDGLTKGQAFKARLKSPFRDQGEKSYDGYVPGAIFVTATSKDRPGLVDQDLHDIIDPSEFYSGVYARATVRVFTYEVEGNVGVAFGLQNIQKLRDGESLAGRMKAQNEFEPVKDAGAPAAGGGMFD